MDWVGVTIYRLGLRDPIRCRHESYRYGEIEKRQKKRQAGRDIDARENLFNSSRT
jgi:hypothetical protein